MRHLNLFITLAFLLSASSTFAQAPSTSSGSAKCQFSEVFRHDGWTIPGTDSAKSKQRTALAKHAGMFITKYEPLDADISLTIATCKSTQEGRLEIKEVTAKIIKLWAFDAGSKPFAYRIEYAESASDDKRAEPGTSIIFFYDLDGSGTFTLFKYADPAKSLMLPSIIPDWAQNEMDQPAPHQ